MPPQPSPARPHSIPRSVHVLGTHAVPIEGETHFEGAFGPPQRSPEPHFPQSGMMPPQPLPAGPHSTPCSAHVRGLHCVLLTGPPSPAGSGPPTKLPGGGGPPSSLLEPFWNVELPSVPHAATMPTARVEASSVRIARVANSAILARRAEGAVTSQRPGLRYEKISRANASVVVACQTCRLARPCALCALCALWRCRWSRSWPHTSFGVRRARGLQDLWRGSSSGKRRRLRCTRQRMLLFFPMGTMVPVGHERSHHATAEARAREQAVSHRHG